MNKGILKRYSLRVLCLIGLLASCSEEQPANNSALSTGKPVEMRLQVNAPLSGTVADPESAIHRLRMVVFGSMGSPDPGKLILNTYYPTVPAGNVLKEIITSGRRDIYLIANEPLSEAGEELAGYKEIATVADVRKLSLAYQVPASEGIYTPTEIPMFVGQLNQQISVDDPNKIDGEVVRTLAKVTLNLNVKNSNFTTTGKQPVVIDHITIKNLPKSSFLIPQNYTGDLVDSEKQNVVVANAASDYDRSTTNTFYVPEYLFNDPSKGAYIEIIGHIDGEPNRKTKYSVKLGDAMDENNTYGDRYHITRNRHYTFTGNVKSYGEMDGVEVKVTVKPWNTVNMDEEVGRYLAFSKVTNGAGSTIAEGINLDDVGTTIKVYCSTNIGGWYTVTRDAKGTIVHQSDATASVSGVTTQNVSVPIPNLKELPYLQSYTVGIYHRALAQESVAPVKSLNFTQRGGFIPNSVLTAGGSYGVWPADKLPPNGLQLAMRGSKVLPGGATGGNDLDMKWKTSQSVTGGTYAGLGTGASSTAAMAGDEHPAAQYCRDMGEEGWFLPSIDELELIYKNKSTLGASYTFYTYYYWSATEDSEYYSKGVPFSTGIPANGGKLISGRVRCVKYI